MDVKRIVKELESELYEIYCYLHENPEISMKEYNTCAYLKKLLQEKTKVDKIVQIGETGLMAEMVGGKAGPRKVMALRADIDALPMQESEGNNPRSKVPGVMHACGHDMHAAILYGTIRVLENYRDQISGSILFFFQQAEETFQGGEIFANSPEIDFNEIEGVVAVHVLPDLEVGYIGATKGPALATIENFDVVVRGKTGHAGHPHESIDPVIAAAQMICSLQTMVSKEIPPINPCVLSITKIEAGEQYGIVPEIATFGGTLRAATTETRLKMKESLIRICENIASSMRTTAKLSFKFGNPPVINDDAWLERMYRSGQKLFGNDKVVETKLRMPGEDFGYMLEKSPGLYLRVGCKSLGEPSFSNHQPDFYCDRGSLETGIIAMAGMALDFYDAEY